jgi:hypothetical protein
VRRALRAHDGGVLARRRGGARPASKACRCARCSAVWLPPQIVSACGVAARPGPAAAGSCLPARRGEGGRPRHGGRLLPARVIPARAGKVAGRGGRRAGGAGPLRRSCRPAMSGGDAPGAPGSMTCSYWPSHALWAGAVAGRIRAVYLSGESSTGSAHCAAAARARSIADGTAPPFQLGSVVEAGGDGDTTAASLRHGRPPQTPVCEALGRALSGTMPSPSPRVKAYARGFSRQDRLGA